MARKSNEVSRLTRELSNSKAIAAGTLLAVAGFIILGCATWIRGESLESAPFALSMAHSFGIAVGGGLISAGVLGIAWELFSRRAFAQELLARVSLGQDVKESGLLGVNMNWLSVIDWNEAIQNSKTIDVVVAYNDSWFTRNESQYRETLKSGDVKLTAVIANPQDDDLLEALSRKFSNKPTEEISQRASQAIQRIGDLNQHYDAKVEVKVYDRPIDHAFYRFDNTVVVTPYTVQGRINAVPALAFDVRGTVGRHFLNEIQAHKDAASPWEANNP